MTDKVDEDLDSKLSSFVINQHLKNHPYVEENCSKEIKILPEEIKTSVFKHPQEFLKEYIKYARTTFEPELTTKASKIINDFYLRVRKDSEHMGGLIIVARHL